MKTNLIRLFGKKESGVLYIKARGIDHSEVKSSKGKKGRD